MRAAWRLLVLACLAGVLASCSAVRVAYNNAEVLVRFEADGYFDFDEGQALQFRERLARYHDWHRHRELPAYIGLAEAARTRAAAGLKQTDVAWAIAAMRDRYHVAAAQAVEDAAPILTTLQERQFKVLEKKFADNNRKYAKEFLSGDERSQMRARTKRMWNRFEDWIGNLDDAQEARIERFVREHGRYTELRFEDRKLWQRQAIELLRRYRDPAGLAARLAPVFTHPETRRSAEYATVASRWEAELADLIVDIDRSLSQDQRRHALKRIDAYIADFRALAFDAAGSK